MYDTVALYMSHVWTFLFTCMYCTNLLYAPVCSYIYTCQAVEYSVQRAEAEPDPLQQLQHQQPKPSTIDTKD